MRNEIKVSFKNTDSDNELYDAIVEISEEYGGKSAWMKLAAREKIKRDRGEVSHSNQLQKINNAQSDGVINSLDDLFKQ